VSTGLSGVYFEDAIDLRAGGMLQIADADHRAEFHRGSPSIVFEPWKPKFGSVQTSLTLNDFEAAVSIIPTIWRLQGDRVETV
jgi:hypothetical protein